MSIIWMRDKTLYQFLPHHLSKGLEQVEFLFGVSVAAACGQKVVHSPRQFVLVLTSKQDPAIVGRLAGTHLLDYLNAQPDSIAKPISFPSRWLPPSPNQWLKVHIDRDFHAATGQGELVSYSVTKPIATLEVSDPALEEYLAACDGVHLALDKNCPQIH
ncbi:hypothetical protein DVH24_013110 [Malus domestica]|uniref:Uncharacterized protein n=1 Tax=Malus domestica TaxID=3750 RepID=A0A498IP17_MALDO|nr:hypothetical protein DVH24_013110 [Malus domestica]